LDFHRSDQRYERPAETPVSEMTCINIMDYSQVIYQIKLLVYRANSALYFPQSTCTQFIQTLTQYTHFTRGRKQGPIQQSDKRAFPCPAWTNQSNPLASLNFKGNVLKCREITKFPADLEQFKYRLIAYLYDSLPYLILPISRPTVSISM
jgi:hypothetical protein